METVASAWVHDAGSSYQGQENQHLSSYGGLCPQPEATIKLSPHLHRNKQLQDTLQQREEELARLQQENDKLRHFLSSSFVKNLEEKVKGLSSDHRGNLKRCLQQDHRTDQNLSSCRSHPAAQRISTRVCRNLFPEFCSDPGPPREPNLDLWVLQTLGLKDRDTIDPSASPNSFRLNPSSSSIRRLTPPHQPSSHFSAPSSYEPSAILPDLPQSLSSSSSLTSQTHTAPIPQPGAVPSFQMLTPPPTPRKDVVFRGSLSPSSSFKTHSFPQGQAFIRKDTQGCWSFTWIPKQNP
ncbi:geminin coiled-coil domain-containing protein 1 [Gadus chalcogrammus]|uniref:geminin coiled-coil domain-containing protein 1 n=1 Tax=Gadus chalcogrammus TaxID=1042646 RepID=UPI0024C47B85|nr:geminin coiled-coil domain-containing protein 1 [Gadus chalcogrammus]